MKRILGMVALFGFTTAFFAMPTQAAPLPKIVLQDPAEDANFLNDQGTGDGSVGDHNGAGADASMVADLLTIGFSNDKKNLYVFVKTQLAGRPEVGEGFRVRVNPGSDGVYCLNFEFFFDGAQNDLADVSAQLRDACAADALTEAKVEVSPLGGFGYMIAVARKVHEALGKGKTLVGAQAQSFLYSGSTQVSNYPGGIPGPYFDTTKVGQNYKLKK